MKYWIIALVIAALSSCSSMPGMPGFIDVKESKFDGSKIVSMEPAFVGYSDQIKMGLYWQSTLPEEVILLTVWVRGAELFSSGKSLHFNVDGEFYSLDANDDSFNVKTTNGGVYNSVMIPPSNWSGITYRTSKNFIKKINSAKKVIVKVDLRAGYLEGEHTVSNPTSSKTGFVNFFKKIDSY
ncbi:hypothetical protein MN202_15105 [Rheinheimera muenzenbergensis]|uniref:Uncharacterized protein n=1 Tax=Rheinheimera muenzenbergensis TaxID=1193628 RepID=A0ABU8C9D4_9GAMM